MAGPAQGNANLIRRRRPNLLRYFAIAALIAIILLGALVLIIWLVIKPKEVRYTVEDGSIHSLSLTKDTLNATFDLNLRTYNPNYRVAIYYDSIVVSLLFDDQTIAYGHVPPFFQPHRNATRFQTRVVGEKMILQSSVSNDLRQTKLSKGIEVEVRVKARIRFKVRRWKSRKYSLRVYCSPVVLYLHSSKAFERTYCDVDM